MVVNPKGLRSASWWEVSEKNHVPQERCPTASTWILSQIQPWTNLRRLCYAAMHRSIGHSDGQWSGFEFHSHPLSWRVECSFIRQAPFLRVKLIAEVACSSPSALPMAYTRLKQECFGALMFLYVPVLACPSKKNTYCKSRESQSLFSEVLEVGKENYNVTTLLSWKNNSENLRKYSRWFNWSNNIFSVFTDVQRTVNLHEALKYQC